MMHECQGCGLAYMGKQGLQECVVCKDKPKTKPVKQNVKLNLGFQSKKAIFRKKE